MKSTPRILSAFLLCISSLAQAQITSTFDTDTDGWTALNANVGEPIFVNTGGNPGGFIRASDAVGGVQTTMVAPAKFLGNRIFSYGQFLRFDLKVSLASTTSNNDIEIYGGGTSLVRNLIPPLPNATTWTTYSQQLHEDEVWRIGSTGGPIATKEQVKQVLSSVTAIHIGVEYSLTFGPTDIGMIDNVVLEQRALLPAPIIDSFTPASGPAGTPVTINGTNFNTTPSDNMVYFGEIQASVTSASATQLTVTTPNGVKIGPLTVINVASGLQAESPTSFTPIFTDGGRIIPASLASRVDIDLDATFTPQSYLRGLTAADLDEDGWNDLITFQGDLGGGAGVVIYRNLQVQNDISVNSFSAPIELPLLPGVSGTTYDIESAKDLDGDGKLDLAFMYRQSSPNDGYFVTYRNISTPGNIAFEPVELFSSFNSTNEFTLRMADIDGDGRLDFMGTNQSNTHFFIAQNISTPGNIDFGAAIAYAVADLGTNNVSYSAAGFLNSDAKTDVVLSIDGSTQLMILENTSVPGTLSFAPGITIDMTNEISQPIIADINDDGKNDILWRKTGIPEIGIRINNNTGGALSAADFATEIILTAELLNVEGFVTVGDINGDGKKDIICTDSFDMLIFENVHTGGAYNSNSFVEAYNFRATSTTATTPAYPMAVDLDGDQKPEVVTGISNSAGSKFISIFKNINTHSPTISLNTVSPLKGPVGTTVIITGDYFSTVPSENLVRFGSIKAMVTAATRTQLTVTVPAGAPTGLVSVTRDALTSTYRLPFVHTFSSGVVFNNTHFAPPVNFTATSAGINVGVSDLNGDGKPDVMVNNTTGSNGYAFRNTHVSGAISVTSLMADDTTNRFTHFADFDGDGLEETMGDATLYRNVSVGLEIDFAGTTSVLGNGTNRSFGDYNADGKIDLAGVSGATILFAENETQPGFQATSSTTRIFKDFISLAKPGSGGGSASADFDGDGLTDVAGSNPTLDNVSVFRNTGAYRITPTQFTSVPEIAVGDNPYRIYANDLDVDGKVDLLVIHQTTTTSQFVTVLHNQSTIGNISFTRFDYPIGAFATEAHISDLDGDGRPDILVTSETTDQFFIVKNTSTPGVMDASSFATPFSTAINNPRGITTGDLNLDGKPEIIVAAGSVLAVYENLIASSCVLASERAALIALYNATDGLNWTDNTNWLSADESTWFGVSLTGCQVTGIFLSNNNLNGSLPTELGDLTGLISLSITLNPNLSGSIPGSLGNLLQLTNLQLWNNNMTGPIPSTLGNLNNLVRLELLNNQLSGAIPSTLGNLTSLEHLQLQGNQLTGIIPTSLFGLTNLKTLELGANQLTGSISPSIAGLTNLESLGLSGNQLSGNIPTEIGTMTSLTRLVLAVNLLNGTLPSSLGNLVNLTSFTVFNNQLSGAVPASLSNLVNLAGLGLSVNQFTGDLPSGIGLIPNLSDVSVRDNDFTSIPTFVSTSFTDLLVYGNKLHFGHLEPNISKTGFVYSPQDNLPGGTLSICEGSTLTINFSTPGTANQYQWYKDGSPIAGANSANFSKTNATASDAGNYTVQVTNTIVTGLTLTSDPFNVSIEQAPCSNQPPVIASTASGAQIEGMVTIDLLTLISDPDENLDLSTLSVVGSASNEGASVSINASSELVLDYSGVLFTGIDIVTIEVCDLSGVCVQQELTIEVVGDVIIYNAISPNPDDNLNNIFTIQYIDIFPDTEKNKVTIYNRWGDIVWEGIDYDNSSVVFDGTSTQGKELPTGTYFYKIEFTSGRAAKTGYLSLKK